MDAYAQSCPFAVLGVTPEVTEDRSVLRADPEKELDTDLLAPSYNPLFALIIYPPSKFPLLPITSAEETEKRLSVKDQTPYWSVS